jgi:hypothetical protein
VTISSESSGDVVPAKEPVEYGHQSWTRNISNIFHMWHYILHPPSLLSPDVCSFNTPLSAHTQVANVSQVSNSPHITPLLLPAPHKSSSICLCQCEPTPCRCYIKAILRHLLLTVLSGPKFRSRTRRQNGCPSSRKEVKLFPPPPTGGSLFDFEPYYVPARKRSVKN